MQNPVNSYKGNVITGPLVSLREIFHFLILASSGLGRKLAR